MTIWNAGWQHSGRFRAGSVSPSNTAILIAWIVSIEAVEQVLSSALEMHGQAPFFRVSRRDSCRGASAPGVRMLRTDHHGGTRVGSSTMRPTSSAAMKVTPPHSGAGVRTRTTRTSSVQGSGWTARLLSGNGISARPGKEEFRAPMKIIAPNATMTTSSPTPMSNSAGFLGPCGCKSGFHRRIGRTGWSVTGVTAVGMVAPDFPRPLSTRPIRTAEKAGESCCWPSTSPAGIQSIHGR